MCFEGVIEKKIFEDFGESLLQFSNKINKRLTRQSIMIHPQTYTGVRTKKGKSRYSISISSLKGAGEDIDTYCKIFPLLVEIIKLSKKLAWKPDKALCCTSFYFSDRRYRLGGELILPTTLPSTSIFAEKLGVPSLSGFSVQFDKSPVGLEGVEIGVMKESEMLIINCSHSFRPSDEKDMFRVTFNKSLDLAKLFVVNK
jgi:hypothetical protein